MEGSEMLTLLAQYAPHHYGFLGIDGFVGIFIGLIIFLIVAAILWKIATLVMAQVGVPASWVQIISLLFLFVILLVFLHLFGLY
jgi:hypothetical protein